METFKYRDYKIIIKRKRNNKNTFLRVESDGSITVTCPVALDTKVIIDYLDKFLDKIAAKYDSSLFNKLDYLDGGTFIYLGKYYQIKYHLARQQSCHLTTDCLHVYLKDTGLENVKNVIDKFIKIQAQKIIQPLFLECVDKFEEIDFIPDLKIKKMKSRFGVCYYKKNLINLSTLLIHYDLECLNYVIFHELVHFIQPNHSKKFYYLVEKYIPNYKEVEKKLKNIAI